MINNNTLKNLVCNISLQQMKAENYYLIIYKYHAYWNTYLYIMLSNYKPQPGNFTYQLDITTGN